MTNDREDGILDMGFPKFMAELANPLEEEGFVEDLGFGVYATRDYSGNIARSSQGVYQDGKRGFW